MNLFTKAFWLMLGLFSATFILLNGVKGQFLHRSDPSTKEENFCATTELTEQLFQSNPEIKKLHNKLEESVYEYMKNNPPSQSRSLPNYTLPVVVHIIHNNGPENISDDLVLQGIQHLNESFANTGYYDQGTGVNTQIEFCIAERDPDGNATNGITRDISPLTDLTLETEDIAMKDINRWDPLNYINIWLVNKICSNSVGCGVAGYAYLPSSHGGNNDGIVMEAKWMGSSSANSTILSHEIGHYLGLYHTFQGGCSNNNCLSNGDRVCDTPPDQSIASVPCNASANTCSSDVNPSDPNNPFTSDQNDMFWNYMDYGDRHCYSAFTMGQAGRMEFFINDTRSTLLESYGCLSPCLNPLISSFISSVNLVEIGNTVDFTNTSSGATDYEWLIDDVPFSNNTDASYNFPNEGFYIITLNATNDDPNCFESFSDTIEVVCPVVADFNANMTIAQVNELVELTNNSSNATGFEWTLDGVAQGNSTDFSFSLTNPAVVQVCLEATGPICNDTHCEFISIISDADEDCDFTYIKTFGENGVSEGGTTIIHSGDGNFFLTGYQEDSILLIKMSQAGEPFWIRSFNVTNGIDRIAEIKIDSENNIIGCGNSYLPNNNNAHYFAFKYDFTNDTILWTKQIIQPVNNFGYRAVNIFEPIVGGDYLVVFNSNRQSHLFELNRDTGGPTANLAKLYDTYNGNQIWTNVTTRAAIVHNNSLKIAGGYKDSPNIHVSFVSRLDLDGNEIWSRRSILTPNFSVYFYATDIIEDDGTLVTSFSGDDDYDFVPSQDLILQKSDMDGNMLWVRKYVTSSPGSHGLKEIIAVPDGYILFGWATQGYETLDYFLIKTDKDGEAQWAKKYIGDEVPWNQNEHKQLPYMQSELIKFDGSLYFTGRIRKSIDSLYQIFLIRTDFDGNVEGGCENVVDLDVETIDYTNPVNDDLNLAASDSPRDFESIDVSSSLLASLPDTSFCGFFCTEICDNGIDDDSDQLIDFYDPDCPCSDTIVCGTPFYNICAPECESSIEYSPIEIEVLWSAPSVYNLNLNLVSDVNGDCTPDVISIGYTNSISIEVRNGDSGILLYSFPIITTMETTNFVSGDVDNDGMAELFVISGFKLIRLDYNPGIDDLIVSWISSSSVSHFHSLGLADFDANGIPEIYAGNQIFNSQTGLELVNGGINNVGLIDNPSLFIGSSTSVASDVLSEVECVFCQGLELVAGGQVYTVNIASYINPSLNSMIVEKEFQFPGFGTIDGATRVVDFDKDGDLDIIVSTSVNSSSRVFIWDVLTESLVGNPYINLPNADYDKIGPATIGDVDNDGWPEIVVTTKNNLTILEDYKNGGESNWGNPITTEKASISTFDKSGATGTSIFDLNGDGYVEIFLRDEESFMAFDGDLNQLSSLPCIAISQVDYPVIADINGDGETEILCGCSSELIAFRSANVPWQNSRKIWNQYNYFVTNVNDDGTIPVQQQNHHIVGDSIIMNGFLVQQPILLDEDSTVNLTEAVLTIDSAFCNNDAVEVFVSICNTRDFTLPAVTPITIYFGDPTTSVPVIVSTIPLGVDLEAGDCFNAFYTIPNAINQTIFIVVNDDASGTFPYNLETDFPLNSIEECDFENNIDNVEVNGELSPPVDLGPDVLVCNNGVFEFNAGSGFDYYKWQDGSTDSTFTTWAQGTYWVTAWNDCSESRSDTVQVTIDSATVFDLGLDTILCGGGEVTYSVLGYDHYEWFPKTGIDCDSCETATISPSVSATYTLVASTDIGCISVDSVEIIIADIFNIEVDTGVCVGETIIYDGIDLLPNTSTYFNYSSIFGCDSTVLVNVIALDTFYTTIDTSFCEGETIFFNGEELPANTSASFNFTSVFGCDSTILVNTNGYESYYEELDTFACPGNSIVYDGVSIPVASSQVFDYFTVNGCDSTIVVNVALLDTFYTTIDTSFCEGEMIFFEGVELQANTSTSFNFTSVFGCDSTILINTYGLETYYEALDTFACVGSSIIYDGILIPVNGTQVFNYFSVNNCDSTIVVNVASLDTFYTEFDTSFCEGETIFFEGVELQANISTSFNYTTVFGCDSTILVNTIGYETYYEEQDAYACAGSSVIYDGISIPASGSQVFDYFTVQGCDSTVVVNVQSLDTFYTTIDTSICEGEVLIFNGEALQINTSTSFNYSTDFSCDSTILVNVNSVGFESYFEEIDTFACIGSFVIYDGISIPSGNIQLFDYFTIQGCDSTIVVNVMALDTFYNAENQSICEGESMIIFGNEVSIAGDYSMTFGAANGCDSTVVISLEVYDAPEIILSGEPSCPESATGIVQAIVNGGTEPYHYNWNVSNENIGELQGIAAGNYEVTVTDNNNCTDAASIDIVEILESPVTGMSVDVTCFGAADGSFQVDDIFEDYLFSLDGIFYQNTLLFDNLTFGTYELYIQDPNGCEFVQMFTIDEPAPIILNMPANVIIELGDSLLIDPTIYAADSLNYFWNPSTGLSCLNCPNPIASPIEDILYTLTVMDVNGCLAEDAILVEVDRSHNIFIPNVFSPNFDGMNDVFMIHGGQGIKEILSFRIYDRWGEQMFEAKKFQPEDPAFAWDGTFNGKFLNPGVFVYVIEIALKDGRILLYKGDVTLVK